MNKFYLSVVLILSFNFSFSAPTIKSVKDGYWNTASTWNLNRLPQAGDSIIIAAGNVVTINTDISLNAASFLKVYGKLNFQNNNSTLSLANGSFVWVFSGAVIIGSGTPSQKLRLDGNTIFDGGDDPVYGPLMASSTSNGFAAMVNATPIVLPVKFIGFTLTSKNSDVLIQWSTSEEISAGKYDIERSIDGNNWSIIASLTAKGNSSALNNYFYTDKTVSSESVYYRVKEIDVNGQFTYTAVRSIKTDVFSTSEIKIASVNSKVLLQFPQLVKGNVVVRIVSMGGQVMDQQSINNPAGQIVLNSRFSGNYIISISNGQTINTAKQVIL